MVVSYYVYPYCCHGRSPKQPPGFKQNPVNNGIKYLLSGAGFLPSTVWIHKNDYEHHSRSVGIFPFSMHSMQCVVMTAECCTSKDNTNACPSCVWWRDASACAIQTFQAWEFMAQQSQKPLPKWNLTYLLGTYIYIYTWTPSLSTDHGYLYIWVITSCQGGFL